MYLKTHSLSDLHSTWVVTPKVNWQNIWPEAQRLKDIEKIRSGLDLQ